MTSTHTKDTHCLTLYYLSKSPQPQIKDCPDHATFRENGAKLACVDKLGVFLSLTLCNKANFEYMSLNYEKCLQKTLTLKILYEFFIFPDVCYM